MEKWRNLIRDTRYFIITGGRGSGKSFEVGRFITLLSYYPNEKILFTRQTMTSAHLSVIPEVQEKIDFMDRAYDFDVTKTEITNKGSGSKIIFKGLRTSSGDQTANLKSLQGMTCWVNDETEELSDEATFDRIDLSIRQKGVQNRVILILNPTTKAHWIYKRFFEDAGVAEGFTGQQGDVTYIHTTYLDNIENLDPSFLNNIDKMRVNTPSKYNHLILGGWLDRAEGVIFTNWIYGAFDDSLPFAFGMDFGFHPDPDTLVRVAIDEKRKILYCKQELYETKLSPTELAERVAEITHRYSVVADSAEPRLIDFLKQRGVRIEGVKKFAGSVLEGIKMMQDYQIVITPESTKIANELNNYCMKNGQPVSNGYDHLIDCIRYRLMNSRVTRPLTRAT
jgi:phage terminase large subunit